MAALEVEARELDCRGEVELRAVPSRGRTPSWSSRRLAGGAGARASRRAASVARPAAVRRVPRRAQPRSPRSPRSPRRWRPWLRRGPLLQHLSPSPGRPAPCRRRCIRCRFRSLGRPRQCAPCRPWPRRCNGCHLPPRQDRCGPRGHSHCHFRRSGMRKDTMDLQAEMAHHPTPLKPQTQAVESRTQCPSALQITPTGMQLRFLRA